MPGSYVIVSGTKIIWTAQGSFVSAIFFLNQALADLMMKGTILFAILGLTILGNRVVGSTYLNYSVYHNSWLNPSYFRTFGTQSVVCTWAKSGEYSKKISIERVWNAMFIYRYRDRCSTSHRWVQSSVQDTKASVKTAGGHVLKRRDIDNVCYRSNSGRAVRPCTAEPY